MLLAKEARQKTDNIWECRWPSFLNEVDAKINDTINDGIYNCEIFAPNINFANKICLILIDKGYKAKIEYGRPRPLSPKYNPKGVFISISWEDLKYES